MLSRLKSIIVAPFEWLRSRSARLQSRRKIFSYWDGTKTRTIDPIKALLDLEAHPEFNMERHAAGNDAGDPESMRILQKGVCDVFDIPPYDGDKKIGLTMGECMGHFMMFMAYIAGLKKNIESSVTSPQNTEESTSQNSSEPTTSDTADSGSIDGEVI